MIGEQLPFTSQESKRRGIVLSEGQMQQSEGVRATNSPDMPPWPGKIALKKTMFWLKV